MQIKFATIVAAVALTANAAPIPAPAPEAYPLAPAGSVPGNTSVSTNGTVVTIPDDRTMTDTASTNAACSIAFDTARTTIEASHDVTITLNGLISQNKAIASLTLTVTNFIKSLWPGYSATIATEFKPFINTLPSTDAVCKSQINLCLNSLLFTHKVITSSPAGVASACVASNSTCGKFYTSSEIESIVKGCANLI